MCYWISGFVHHLVSWKEHNFKNQDAYVQPLNIISFV
jgi:hypothetical protein